MAGSRCKRSLAAWTFAVLGLSHAFPAPARDRDDDLAAARQAYSKAADASARQSAALRLGVLLLRRATDSAAASAQTPMPDRAAPSAPAELTDAERLFREVVAGGGRDAAEGEAGVIATLLARGPEGAADASGEIQRLQQAGRGADIVLCMAMRDLLRSGLHRDAMLAASDQINDRIHALAPAAPYLVSVRVSKPESLSTPQPRYSEKARKNRLRGRVFLQAVVDRQGHVADVLVLEPGPPGLADSATSAVRQWTYRPALLDGKPVPVCSGQLVFTFDVQ
jgi:TonB family protein